MVDDGGTVIDLVVASGCDVVAVIAAQTSQSSHAATGLVEKHHGLERKPPGLRQ